jgi:uncharacterized membrane protein YfcA
MQYGSQGLSLSFAALSAATFIFGALMSHGSFQWSALGILCEIYLIGALASYYTIEHIPHKMLR